MSLLVLFYVVGAELQHATAMNMAYGLKDGSGGRSHGTITSNDRGTRNFGPLSSEALETAAGSSNAGAVFCRGPVTAALSLLAVRAHETLGKKYRCAGMTPCIMPNKYLENERAKLLCFVAEMFSGFNMGLLYYLLFILAQ